MMTLPRSWTAVCQDPGGGSGNLVVEVPSEILEHLGWSIGDALEIEVVEKSFFRKLKKRPLEDRPS